VSKPLAALALAAMLAPAAPDPVAWQFENPPAKPVKAGARFNLKLVAKIQESWHLYSLKPMSEGPIPTRIWLAEGQPFELAGRIQAPDPEKLQDPSFGMEVEQYEGEADFTLPLKIAAGAPPGPTTLVVNASYQTCNNKICLPPKTVKVQASLTVSK
jgi:thiol:disulfide interchange protein DsbD